jgi:hypothetical protein
MRVVFSFLLVLLALSTANTQEPSPSRSPRSSLYKVFVGVDRDNPKGYAFFEDRRFTTVDDMKSWIETLPKGSRVSLRYAEVFPKRHFLAGSFDTLREFCTARGIDIHWKIPGYY